MQLHEQYRPSCWSEVVGQHKALKRIDALRKRGLAGRAYWISGSSGTGKTTLALLIAREIADEHCINEIDASELTPAYLGILAQNMRLAGLGVKHGRAYIVNEAHGLRRDTIRRLLVTLENLPPHVCWIFTTCTNQQTHLFSAVDDAAPLLSRCAVLLLAKRDLTKPFAERAKMIAEAEGLDGKPIAAYEQSLRTHRNNLRAVLGDIESGLFVA